MTAGGGGVGGGLAVEEALAARWFKERWRVDAGHLV